MKNGLMRKKTVYTQPALTCSKLTIEALEQSEICSKLTIKVPERRQWTMDN